MRARGKLSPIRAVKFIVILAVVTGLVALSATAIGGTSQPDRLSPLGVAGALITSNDQAAVIAVEGWVTDSTEKPISNASVSVGSVYTLSDASGHFSFASSPLASGAGPARGAPASLDVSVSATGFAGWSISQVRYYPGDIVRIYPHLENAGHAATHLSASQPRISRGSGSMMAPSASTLAALSIAGRSNVAMVAQGTNMTPPAQIRVYRTATGQVEVVPFKDYVKHVLPNEWVSSWAPDSLRAGAMAVKEYAWFWIAQGGKQPSLGADVKDNTDDQVYDPNVSYASTDAAVDATWQYSMTRNGALFQASYCAGSYQADPSVDCPWDGNYMTQWGSKYYADQGYAWSWILRFYYPGCVVTPTPPGDGRPIPTPPSAPASQPTQVSNPFTVGQGSTQPQLFQDAYDRNGGAAVLGRPVGAVHWWLQYLSDKNVLAQPFSGADGLDNTWLVFDTLKSDISGVSRAYMITGDIAKAYASHQPPGPEWVGAPTSDPYPASADTLSQGFTSGTLSVNGQGVQFTPWPTQFNGWEGDYFVGKPPSSVQTGPVFDLPGQPADVADVAQPDMSWQGDVGLPEKLGVGKADWSVQFTRIVHLDAGSYDFVLSADSGVRLWVDGLLAVNAWIATSTHTENYNADLDATPHTIRIQYFSPSSAAQLSFSMTRRGQEAPAATPAPPAAQQPAGSSQSGSASLRINVQWLGRGNAPSDAWVQPLTLLLSKPGNPTIIGSFSGATDRNGTVIYSNLPSGTYDVHVKGAHNLQSARASISLTPAVETDVDMKAMLEGDVNGDNCVTVDDLAIVQAMVGADKNTPGYDPSADLNGDGRVTLADVSLLRSGFDRCGDISADNDVQALSTSDAPAGSQDLSPWLNPGAMQKDLSLDLYASAPTVKAGDVFQVEVVANAAGQAIDGGSFLLHYDPAVLLPVDASGNPASISEPGLALPSVLTNWVDGKGGAIGYAASIIQGTPPSGPVVLTTLNFKALRAGPAALDFAPLTSGYMELTNGGVNLLSASHDLSLTVTP